MATKLSKDTFPNGSGPNDYQCFGPPATKDGEFDTVKIADLGCFTQDGKDSNKYYHAAVVQNRNTKMWYTYFEWGRTGATKPTFQFVPCSSESEAQREFAKKLHEKNDKRGEWAIVAGIRTLRAKAGEDCYLVRPMTTRSTGLPDAKTIKLHENSSPKKVSVTSTKRFDNNTAKLLRDLSIATVSYTRGAMADASLPTQQSIDEARQFLVEAEKRLIIVGNKVENQVGDKQLKELTSLMYSRIPKKKKVHSAAEEWILNINNIFAWRSDLDAFESAIYSKDVESATDPFSDLPYKLTWVEPNSPAGKFIYGWWPKASANRHAGVGTMTIKNVWVVDRDGDEKKLEKCQQKVLAEKPVIKERPLFQPKERIDINNRSIFSETNTALLFHGTRSVNVSGILREGLRLPKQLVGVVITGAMFGPGAYFADDWRKSAGYTSLRGSYWSSGDGGVRGRDAFMFAADVVLGNPHVAPSPRGYTAPPHGYHSVFGKGGYSQVQNNEWIIYDTNQNRLKYLVEFTT